jgi:hypothetical protein
MAGRVLGSRRLSDEDGRAEQAIQVEAGELTPRARDNQTLEIGLSFHAGATVTYESRLDTAACCRRLFESSPGIRMLKR